MSALSRSAPGIAAVAVMTIAVACDQQASTPPEPAPVGATTAVYEPDDEDTIPCGPRLVLQTVCQQCHQNPPVNGAPFPLVTRSNITRVSRDGEIRKLMIEQIEVGRMPLFPVTIDYDSRETLVDWLHAGAPAVAPQSCAYDAGPTDGGNRPTTHLPRGDGHEPAPELPERPEEDDGSTDASATD